MVAILACNRSEQSGAGGMAGGEQVRDYQVLTLSPRRAEMSTDYPATIEGQQTVEIRPRVDGYIEQIYVDEGAVVKKGQLLFKINADQFEQEVRSAAANIKISQAAVNSAEMQVKKVRPLVEKDIISRFELESAQYNLESARAQLAQARAQLSNAQTNLSYSKVASPANGVIGRIPYKVGALVSSNITEPLTTVANISNVYAYFSLTEKQLLEFTRITEGASMQEKLAKLPPVELVLSDGTVYDLKGKVETASGLINTQTGSSSLRATFPNPNGVLRSGSTGSVRIPVNRPRAILVPQAATYEIQGKRFVYVVGQDSLVKSVPIRVNSSASGLSFVVEEGLQSGDQVVVEGIGTLRDGVKIKPIAAQPDSVYSKL